MTKALTSVSAMQLVERGIISLDEPLDSLLPEMSKIPILDEDLYIISIVGDRVDNLARQYYGDSNLWWIISSANSEIIKGGSFGIKPGLEIRIPSNHINVLEDYNTLNK